MKLVIEKPVTVITPSIGKPEVRNAIESVAAQTYKCNHLVVCDGPKTKQNLINNVRYDETVVFNNLQMIELTENTGANGFYGHRIYAAFPHLVNSEYILFLDEDNWYEPNHVETLIQTIEENQLDFAYSLRQIYSPDRRFLCNDDCESLGQWPIWFTHEDPQYHMDTSSYCFRREFLTQCCQIWNFGWGGDRRFFNAVRQHTKHDISGKRTLCYRLDGNPNSVTEDFFNEGNAKQAEIYRGNFPWIRN